MALPACQHLLGRNVIDATLSESKATQAQNSNKKFSFESLQKKDPQSKIGARSHPTILDNNGGAYQNEKLEELLAVITGKLVAHSQDPGRAYNITILNTPTVNAFALPGGYLYITRGLLALANDSSEVAAVLAHEMAHVSSNHGVQRSRRAKAVGLADKVANDVVSNPVVGQIVKASTEQGLAAFSQRQELQADAVGIKHLGRAQYDPYAASRFLHSMESYSKWRSSSSKTDHQDMTSSHPSTPRRIELARRHARFISAPSQGLRERNRFLLGIDGMLFGNTAEEGFIRDNHYYHTKLGIKFKVPHGFNLTNHPEAVTANGPNEMALRFDAVTKPNIAFNPVRYISSGWVNGLDKKSVQATTINTLPAARARAYAGDWQFVVTVVAFNKKYYRFILAAPQSNIDIKPIEENISNTFKQLSASEIKNLKPLRIQLRTVGTNDTVEKFAARMKGVNRKLDLFLALNNLAPNEALKKGTKVKLVSD